MSGDRMEVVHLPLSNFIINQSLELFAFFVYSARITAGSEQRKPAKRILRKAKDVSVFTGEQ